MVTLMTTDESFRASDILFPFITPAIANKPTNNINYIRSNKYIFNEINISLQCDKSFTLIKLIASHHYNRTVQPQKP